MKPYIFTGPVFVTTQRLVYWRNDRLEYTVTIDSDSMIEASKHFIARETRIASSGAVTEIQIIIMTESFRENILPTLDYPDEMINLAIVKYYLSKG